MTYDNKVETPENSTMPGQMLSEARQAKSMSQADVAKRLHLKLQVIQNIENNHYNYDEIPTFIYLRGYLRSYARLVGIPETIVLSSFEALNLHHEEKPRPVATYYDLPVYRQSHKRQHSSKRWFGVIILIICIAAFLGWRDFRNHPRPAEALKDPSKAAPSVTIEQPKNVQPLQLPTSANEVGSTKVK